MRVKFTLRCWSRHGNSDRFTSAQCRRDVFTAVYTVRPKTRVSSGSAATPGLLAASQLCCSSTYMGQLQAQLSLSVSHMTAALEIDSGQ